MKNTELNEAFLYVDDRYLDTVNFTDKENLTMTTNNKTKSLRRLIVAAAVVAAFAIMGTVAYASNLWGIRELWQGGLSEEAADMIQVQDEAYNADDWSCKLTETLYDGNSITATVTISGGDRYIPIPTDASPADSASANGFDFDGTLAEYAESQGKSLMNASASLSIGGKFMDGFMQFESISDNELVILTSANIHDWAIDDSASEAVCTVYANGEKVELPFSLKTGYTKEIGTFAPVDPAAMPGITVGTATVTETELGVYISFPVTVTNEEAFGNTVIGDCDTVTDFRSGGFVMGADGVWYAEMDMGQGTVGDTLTVLFEDVMCNPIGEIVFEKE